MTSFFRQLLRRGESRPASDEVRQIVAVAGLRLVEPMDDRVWGRYRTEVMDVRATPLKTPHMLLRQGDTVFTSVRMFLERL